MSLDTLTQERTIIDSVSPSARAPTPEMAITVQDVSKMYPLYADPRDRLRQSLWYALPGFLRRGDTPPEFYKEFWALSHVSFEVQRGKTMGIIGRNGSGKSTLLQIIAGTLTPSHGEVWVNGRVAALLELGSGFNMEFTGRENVYLNGSILGLSQAEIDELYPDIVAFADIGQFVDQPIKLYSSGMVVRLAFAVQAFVPKQVLIVDEALSVGDEAFQRKCMAVLEKFRKAGGTVLLVSHDAQTIVRQCDECLLMHQGRLLVRGESKAVTDLYQKLIYCPPGKEAEVISVLKKDGLTRALNYSFALIPTQKKKTEAMPDTNYSTVSLEDSATTEWFDPQLPQPDEVGYGNGSADIFDYGVYTESGEQVNVLVAGQRYEWVYWVRFYRDVSQVNFGMMLKTTDGVDVSGIASDRENVIFEHIKAGSEMKVTFSIQMNVVPGAYFLNCGVDGCVDDTQLTYLHRRVDVAMVRVLPCDTRVPYGVAYLAPEFRYEYL